MLTTILTEILPQIYQQAGYAVQPPPATVQLSDPNALTILRGFGTEIADRPLITVVRNGGSPTGFWWLGNVGITPDHHLDTVTYWHDQVQILWEVPASSGGEVALDQLVQVFMTALSQNFNVLVQPPPTGYGLYNPRWSVGGVTAQTRTPSGHLLYQTTGQFSATVPVPAQVESPQPHSLLFTVDLLPVDTQELLPVDL